MGKIGRVVHVVMMTLLIFNFSFGFFTITSKRDIVETISTSPGDKRVQYIEGKAVFTVKQNKSQNTAYMGLKISQDGNKKNIVPFTGNSSYSFEYDDVKIKLTVSNTSIELNGNELNFQNGDKEVNFNFNYTAAVESKVGKEGRLEIALTADQNKNLNNHDSSAEFLNINLQDNGSLIGVDIGIMEFGKNVKFGSNTAAAPMVIELKNPAKKPENTFIYYDSEIDLKHVEGRGEPIRMKVSAEGGRGRSIQEGMYLLEGMDNGTPRNEIVLKGTTQIIPGQESGLYKGSIKIRITYTR